MYILGIITNKPPNETYYQYLRINQGTKNDLPSTPLKRLHETCVTLNTWCKKESIAKVAENGLISCPNKLYSSQKLLRLRHKIKLFTGTLYDSNML